MNATIYPSLKLRVEINGEEIQGEFLVVSEWEGLMKLECSGPCATIIIRKPKQPTNPWEFIAPIFGGGQAPDKLESVEVVVVMTDLKIKEEK